MVRFRPQSSDKLKGPNDMFTNHQPAIARFARRSPENFARVVKFVYLTIQQPFHTVGRALQDVDTKGAASSPYAWGWKRDAIAWIDANAADVFAIADELSLKGDEALLAYLADLPGLGLAKGGFVAQLIWGRVGCLDTHNVRRFGLDENAFRAARFKSAKTATTRQKIVRQYLDLCERCGGSQSLWDSWCDFVAEKEPSRYRSGHHVSELHEQFICRNAA